MADILKLMKSLLCVLTAITSATYGYYTYGCYQPKDSPCSIHNLTCSKNTCITLRYLAYNSIPSMATCPLIQDEAECTTRRCCKKTFRDDKIKSLSKPDSLVVFKACSLQQSCSITSPYSNNNTGYNYIEYEYDCMKDSLIHNILTTDTILRNEFMLSYNGKDSPVKGLSCSCNITNAGYIEINYMYLSNESCNRVIVPRGDLSRGTCKKDGILRTGQILYNNYRSRIVFNNMTSNKDDERLMHYMGPGKGKVTASCDCNKAVMGGGWSNWSEYGACSASCGEGISTRRRKCDQPKPANGGSNCVGKASQNTACRHAEECPVDYGHILPRIGFGFVVVVILICVILWFRRQNRNTNVATSDENEPSVHYESTPGEPSNVSHQYASLSNTGEYITVF